MLIVLIKTNVKVLDCIFTFSSQIYTHRENVMVAKLIDTEFYGNIRFEEIPRTQKIC